MNLKDLFYLNRSDRSVLLFFLALAVAAVAVIALSDGAEKRYQHYRMSIPQKYHIISPFIAPTPILLIMK